MREIFKISVWTSASSPAQSLSTCPGMLFGPAVFRVLTMARVIWIFGAVVVSLVLLVKN